MEGIMVDSSFPKLLISGAPFSFQLQIGGMLQSYTWKGTLHRERHCKPSLQVPNPKQLEAAGTPQPGMEGLGEVEVVKGKALLPWRTHLKSPRWGGVRLNWGSSLSGRACGAAPLYTLGVRGGFVNKLCAALGGSKAQAWLGQGVGHRDSCWLKSSLLV